MQEPVMKRIYSLATKAASRAMGALAVLMLAGCATSLSAHVTSFQQWPDGVAGQYYEFVAGDASQAGNLEYQAYRDMVRAAIGATGLVEARPGATARFEVAFSYGTEPTQVITRQPVDPFFYGGGFYGPRWGWGGYFGPDWVPVPVSAVRNKLTVQIRDKQQGGKEVYRSSAIAVTGREALPEVMPYLVRAVFDDFPGNNGRVREVRYRLD